MTQLLTLTATATSTASANNTTAAGNADFTVLFCIIGLLVCIGIPLATILLGVLKYEGSLKQTLWSIAGYIVFTLMLYSVVSAMVLPGYTDQTATNFEATILVIIRCFCEAIGMFLLLLFLRKRQGIGNALTFSAGYCFMECLMLGFILVCYLIVITSPGDNEISAIRELRIYVQDNNLVAGEEWRFIIKAFMAVIFCGLQLSSVVVMFVGVQLKKYWLGIVSVIFALLIRIPNRMHAFQVWFWGNNAIIIPYLAIMTVIICLIAYTIWKNNKDELDKKKEVTR